MQATEHPEADPTHEQAPATWTIFSDSVEKEDSPPTEGRIPSEEFISVMKKIAVHVLPDVEYITGNEREDGDNSVFIEMFPNDVGMHKEDHFTLNTEEWPVDVTDVNIEVRGTSTRVHVYFEMETRAKEVK